MPSSTPCDRLALLAAGGSAVNGGAAADPLLPVSATGASAAGAGAATSGAGAGAAAGVAGGTSTASLVGDCLEILKATGWIFDPLAAPAGLAGMLRSSNGGTTKGV